MKRQWIVVALVALAGCSFAGLLAYRRAIRQPTFSNAVSFASSAAGKGPCVDFHDAKTHLGETACVSGRVARVFTSRGGNTFLDFCADYRSCPFTTVIFSSDRTHFGNLDTLAGRRVEIEGPITSYQGRAEIVIRDPKQVRVLP
jgi:hypothetical protein